MKTNIEECRLVLRGHSHGKGIRETSLPVTSLEQLYDFCVSADSHLIERLQVAGRDAQGRRLLLTFTFQSVSDSQPA